MFKPYPQTLKTRVCSKCGTVCLDQGVRIDSCNNCNPYIKKLIADAAKDYVSEDEELMFMSNGTFYGRNN